MISMRKKDVCLQILFDTIPIENYIFSLFHAEIGIGNNIFKLILYMDNYIH